MTQPGDFREPGWAQAASPPPFSREQRAPSGGQSWDLAQSSLARTPETSESFTPVPEALRLSRAFVRTGKSKPIRIRIGQTEGQGGGVADRGGVAVWG